MWTDSFRSETEVSVRLAFSWKLEKDKSSPRGRAHAGTEVWWGSDGLASLPLLRIYHLYFVRGLNWPLRAGRMEVVAN